MPRKIELSKVLACADALMQSKHGVPIRSRQVRVLAEVLVEAFNHALDLDGIRPEPLPVALEG